MAINLSLNKLPWYGQIAVFVAIGIGGARMQEECAQAGIDAVFPKAPAASAQR